MNGSSKMILCNCAYLIDVYDLANQIIELIVHRPSLIHRSELKNWYYVECSTCKGRVQFQKLFQGKTTKKDEKMILLETAIMLILINICFFMFEGWVIMWSSGTNIFVLFWLHAVFLVAKVFWTLKEKRTYFLWKVKLI